MQPCGGTAQHKSGRPQATGHGKLAGTALGTSPLGGVCAVSSGLDMSVAATLSSDDPCETLMKAGLQLPSRGTRPLLSLRAYVRSKQETEGTPW